MISSSFGLSISAISMAEGRITLGFVLMFLQKKAGGSSSLATRPRASRTSVSLSPFLDKIEARMSSHSCSSNEYSDWYTSPMPLVQVCTGAVSTWPASPKARKMASSLVRSSMRSRLRPRRKSAESAPALEKGIKAARPARKTLVRIAREIVDQIGEWNDIDKFWLTCSNVQTSTGALILANSHKLWPDLSLKIRRPSTILSSSLPMAKCNVDSQNEPEEEVSAQHLETAPW